MIVKLKSIARAVRISVARAMRRASGHPHSSPLPPGGEGAETPAGEPEKPGTPLTTDAVYGLLLNARRGIMIATVIVATGWVLVAHPPLATAERGELGLRVNQLTGDVVQWRDGTVLALPLLHQVQRLSLRDRSYQPQQIARADGAAPVQSVEGLSLGVDLVVRYALDPQRVATVGRHLPHDVDRDIVAPAVQGVVYKVFARYTVREIFSSKRAEIQLAMENELKTRLATDGLLLRSVVLGKVDLPADYKRGMEGLLAEELQTQKMRYTLELKDKRVKENELDASAEKVRREVNAEAAAREQVIAAKAQEEAMKHVLPFKQRQIEQRQLEAEAEKVSRMKIAEGNAQARRIEAHGEADARRQLAEAEAFRLQKIGLANSEQLAREGALVSQHPLLIQKVLADKLSDKVQVIVAPPGVAGGLLGSTLLGTGGVMAQRQGLQQAAARGTQAEGEE